MTTRLLLELVGRQQAKPERWQADFELLLLLLLLLLLIPGLVCNHFFFLCLICGVRLLPPPALFSPSGPSHLPSFLPPLPTKTTAHTNRPHLHRRHPVWACVAVLSLSSPSPFPLYLSFSLSHSHTLLACGYLVDLASSHMLVSKIKPCMPKYKPSLYGDTANGSLNQL